MTDFKREYLCYPVAEYVPPRCNICGRELHNHHGSRYERCAVPGSDLCLALGAASQRGQAAGFKEGFEQGRAKGFAEATASADALVETVSREIQRYAMAKEKTP